MQKFEEYAYEACYKLQDKTVVFNGVSRNIKKKNYFSSLLAIVNITSKRRKCLNNTI